MGAPQQEEVKSAERNGTHDPSPTPMSHAEFTLWKQRKDALAANRAEEAARKRAEDIEAGRVQLNGRELFEHEPWVFDDSRFEIRLGAFQLAYSLTNLTV